MSHVVYTLYEGGFRKIKFVFIFKLVYIFIVVVCGGTSLVPAFTGCVCEVPDMEEYTHTQLANAPHSDDTTAHAPDDLAGQVSTCHNALCQPNEFLWLL